MGCWRSSAWCSRCWIFALWQFRAATVAQEGAIRAQAEAQQQRAAAETAALDADQLRKAAVQAQADSQQLRDAAQAATLEATAAKAHSELRRMEAEDAERKAADARAEAEQAQAQADAARSPSWIESIRASGRPSSTPTIHARLPRPRAPPPPPLQTTAEAAQAQAGQQRQAADEARRAAEQAETRAVVAQTQAEQERKAADEAKAAAANERSNADVYLQKLDEAQLAAKAESTPSASAGACANSVEYGFGQLWQTENGVRSRSGLPAGASGVRHRWHPVLTQRHAVLVGSGVRDLRVLRPGLRSLGALRAWSGHGRGTDLHVPDRNVSTGARLWPFLAGHKAVLDRLGNCATSSEEGPKQANNDIGARQFFDNGLLVFMPLTPYTGEKRIWALVDDGSHTAGTYVRYADHSP